MLLISMVIVSLSGSGYWTADGPAELTIARPARAAQTLHVHWQLVHSNGETVLARGQVILQPADERQEIELMVPPVPAPTQWTLHYQVREPQANRMLQRSQLPVHIHPAVELSDERPLLIVGDDRDGLGWLLDQYEIAFEHAPRLQPFAADRDTLVVVTGTREPRHDMQRWLRFAHNGGDVMLLRDAADLPNNLAVRAEIPSGQSIVWDLKHPLLRNLDEQALDAWMEHAEPLPLRLSREAQVDLVAHWPNPNPQQQPATVLAIQQLGQGRIIWCRIPISSWEHDARARLLLRNLLQYLADEQPTGDNVDARTPLPSIEAEPFAGTG